MAHIFIWGMFKDRLGRFKGRDVGHECHDVILNFCYAENTTLSRLLTAAPWYPGLDDGPHSFLSFPTQTAWFCCFEDDRFCVSASFNQPPAETQNLSASKQQNQAVCVGKDKNECGPSSRPEMYAWFYLAEKVFAMIAAKEAVGRRRTCPVHLHIHHFCACFWRRLLLPIGSLRRPRSGGQIPSGTYTVRMEVSLTTTNIRCKRPNPSAITRQTQKLRNVKRKKLRNQKEPVSNLVDAKIRNILPSLIWQSRRCHQQKVTWIESVERRRKWEWEGPWPRLEVAITFGWDRLRAKSASQEVTITNLFARMKGITENPERKSLFSSSSPFVQLNLRFRSLTKSTALLTHKLLMWLD